MVFEPMETIGTCRICNDRFYYIYKGRKKTRICDKVQCKKALHKQRNAVQRGKGMNKGWKRILHDDMPKTMSNVQCYQCHHPILTESLIELTGEQNKVLLYFHNHCWDALIEDNEPCDTGHCFT